MSTALIVALIFTVAMICTTAYFFLGSVPLLVLKHDTPKDAHFVRVFFGTYYTGAKWTAAATAIGFAVAGRYWLAAGAAALALLAHGLRKNVLPRMEVVDARIQAGDAQAIRDFRKIHVTALGINVLQLIVMVGSLIGARF